MDNQHTLHGKAQLTTTEMIQNLTVILQDVALGERDGNGLDLRRGERRLQLPARRHTVSSSSIRTLVVPLSRPVNVSILVT